MWENTDQNNSEHGHFLRSVASLIDWDMRKVARHTFYLSYLFAKPPIFLIVNLLWKYFYTVKFVFLLVIHVLNSLSANFTKWSNTLKQFVTKLPTNCLSVFDHFVRLALKGLNVFNVSGILWVIKSSLIKSFKINLHQKERTFILNILKT